MQVFFILPLNILSKLSCLHEKLRFRHQKLQVMLVKHLTGPRHLCCEVFKHSLYFHNFSLKLCLSLGGEKIHSYMVTFNSLHHFSTGMSEIAPYHQQLCSLRAWRTFKYFYLKRLPSNSQKPILRLSSKWIKLN